MRDASVEELRDAIAAMLVMTAVVDYASFAMREFGEAADDAIESVGEED